MTDLLTGLLPRPTIEAHACSRRLGSGCTACFDACPKQALRITSSDAPAIDPLLCVGCGLCEAQCPTQAISGVAASADIIVNAARGMSRLRLRCEAARTSGARLGTEQPGAAGLDVGCLAALHPETVAASAGLLLKDGILQLVRGDCDRCPMGAGEAVESMIAESRSCLDTPGRIAVGQVVDGGGTTEAAQRPTARMSRRALFRSASPKRVAEDAVAAASSLRGDQSPRQWLLQSLSGPALPRPHVEDGCTGCRACVNVCPKGALSCTDADDVFELTVDPTACVGCWECVRVCPEDVIQPAGRATGKESIELTRIELGRCVSCGMRLSPGEDSHCAACSSRQGLVSDVWRHYGL